MTGHINDINTIVRRHSLATKNHDGELWKMGVIGTIILGTDNYYLGMTIGATPITLVGFGITTFSTDTDVYIYEGGTYSGGTGLAATALNRVKSLPFPATDAKDGVTIDTPGVEIFHLKLRNAAGQGNNQPIFDQSSSSGMIMKPNTVYYLETFNNDTVETYDADFTLTTHDDG